MQNKEILESTPSSSGLSHQPMTHVVFYAMGCVAALPGMQQPAAPRGATTELSPCTSH